MASLSAWLDARYAADYPGIQGVVYGTAIIAVILAAPEGVFWRPSLPAKVAGTAGAGDSFTSTTVAALAEGVAPGEALLQAAINAASVVGVIDTTAGLLGPEQMERRRAEIGEVALRRFDYP